MFTSKPNQIIKKLLSHHILAICTYITIACPPAASAYSFLEDPWGIINDSPDFRACYEKQISQEQPLHLEDIIEIAICNNPSLRQTYMQAKATAAVYGQAISAYMPQVKAGADIGRTYSDSAANPRAYNSPVNGNISLSWLLFDFGATPANVERTKQNLVSANFYLNYTLQNTVYSVAESYYNLLGTIEVIKSVKANEESAKLAYEAASKRYELGVVALSDKLQAETAYGQTQLAVTRAENNLQISQGRLLALLNLSPYIQLNIAPFASDIKELKFQKDIKELIQDALKRRPDLAAKQADLKAAEASLDYAKRKNLPTVSLFGRVGASDRLNRRSADSNDWRAGVELSFPIFTGFNDTYGITQSRYQYEGTKADLARTEKAVETDVWNAYQDYITAIKSYEISLKLFASAVENERVALGAYKAGKGNILNLLNAQSQLATARVERTSAIYNVFIAKSNLLRALSELQ